MPGLPIEEVARGAADELSLAGLATRLIIYQLKRKDRRELEHQSSSSQAHITELNKLLAALLEKQPRPPSSRLPLRP